MGLLGGRIELIFVRSLEWCLRMVSVTCVFFKYSYIFLCWVFERGLWVVSNGIDEKEK